jgi:hypothetical protein
MADIHTLIMRHGRDEARQLIPLADRHLVDIAATMLEVPEPTFGITYSGFCLTALPHKQLLDDQRWERHGHNVTLVVEPGVLPDRLGVTKVHGVPYGSRARLILLYLQTQAMKTSSPEVELGASMRAWLSRMGITIGGKQYRDVRDQANRISACNLTFIWHNAKGTRFAKDCIVQGGIQLYEQDDNQPRLWVDTVRLSESFFRTLKEHPVPIAEPALRHIANQSMAIDIYIWLAYRLRSLPATSPTPISWAALHQQFGAGYQHVRQFKLKFLEPLKAALAVYPDAKVDVTDTGLTLHHSRPPILEKQLRLV